MLPRLISNRAFWLRICVFVLLAAGAAAWMARVEANRGVSEIEICEQRGKARADCRQIAGTEARRAAICESYGRGGRIC